MLEVLGVKSRKEVYRRDKSELYGDQEKPFSGYSTMSQQNRSHLEEDKNQSHPQTNFTRNPNFSLNTKPNKQTSTFQNKPSENDSKIENFEDDDFKFNLNPKIQPLFAPPSHRDMDRKRAVSSCELNRIKSAFKDPNIRASTLNKSNMYPQLLNYPPERHEPYKRFKHSEGPSTQGTFVNPLIPQYGAPAPPPSLPFLPNLQIDPEMICQMLIRKLAANSGLSNINDICRILPDTLLNRARSNTD